MSDMEIESISIQAISLANESMTNILRSGAGLNYDQAATGITEVATLINAESTTNEQEDEKNKAKAEFFFNLDLLFSSDKLTQKQKNQLRKKLEQSWVKTEKLRMLEDDTDIVLSPSKEKLMNELMELAKDGKRFFILHGPPGTGKTEFIKQLYRRELHTLTNGMMVDNAQPGKTSREYLFTTSLTDEQLPSQSSLDILENAKGSFQTKTNPIKSVRQGLEGSEKSSKKTILADKIVNVITNLLRSKIDTQVKVNNTHTMSEYKKEISNLKIDDGSILEKLEKSSDPNEISDILNEYFTNLDEPQLLAILDNIIIFFENEVGKEKSAGFESINPGNLYFCLEDGMLYLLDEMEKLTNLFHQAGHGLEDIANAKPGDVIPLGKKGVFVRMKEGFFFFAAINDINAMADNWRNGRRTNETYFENSLADLVWQARLLLTDNDGQFILNDRPKDEENLVSFLMWWQAVARHKEIPFSSNNLNSLCKSMQNGNSFTHALDKVLGSSVELKDFYLAMRQKGNRTIATNGGFDWLEPQENDSSFLSLSDLNWQANRGHFIKGEPLSKDDDNKHEIKENDNKPFEVNYDDGVLEIKSNPTPNAVTGGNDYGSKISRFNRDQIGLDDGNDYHVLSHSPQAQTAVIASQDNTPIFVDLLTGKKMVVLTVEEKIGLKQDNASNFSFENDTIMREMKWIDNDSGFMICEHNEKIFLISFQRELLTEDQSDIYKSKIILTNISNIETDKDSIFTMTSNAILVTEKGSDIQHLALPQKSTTNRLPIRAFDGKGLDIKQGEFGTFITTNNGETVRWQT